MNVYIVFEPNNEDCDVYLDEIIEEIIFRELVVFSIREGISEDILLGRNVVLNHIFENLKIFSKVDFEISEFNSGNFNQIFSRRWYMLAEYGAFFISHNPRLVFIKFGQNLRVIDGDEVMSLIQEDFDLKFVDNLAVSIACNIKHLHRGEDVLTNQQPQLHENQDKYVGAVLENYPPVPCSLVLTTNGIQKLCGSSEDSTTIFTKAFSPGFANFSCKHIPPHFASIESGVWVIAGLHGYSTVANALRPSAELEPYASYPVAKYCQSQTKGLQKKYLEILEKNNETIIQGLEGISQRGTHYRIEITLGKTFESNT